MKPERLRELAERLAKAMPERFTWFEQGTYWELGFDKDRQSIDADAHASWWWSLIGPLLDELGVDCVDLYFRTGGTAQLYDTMLESAFVAVVEAAEARR